MKLAWHAVLLLVAGFTLGSCGAGIGVASFVIYLLITGPA